MVETAATIIGSAALEAGAVETAGSLFAFAGSTGAAATSVIGTGLSVLGGISDYMNQKAMGKIQAGNYELQARAAEIQSGQEALRGQQEGNAIKEKLLATLAHNRAAAAGAGISLDSGSFQNVQDASQAEADRALDVSRLDSRMAILSKQSAAYEARSKAAGAITAGNNAARSALFDTAGTLYNRGVFDSKGSNRYG